MSSPFFLLIALIGSPSPPGDGSIAVPTRKNCTTYANTYGISIVKPIYPKKEMKLGIRGTTKLEITIDANGKIIDLRVIQSSGNSNLDRAAIRAGKHSKFAPGKCDDKNIGSTLILPMVFH